MMMMMMMMTTTMIIESVIDTIKTIYEDHYDVDMNVENSKILYFISFK